MREKRGEKRGGRREPTDFLSRKRKEKRERLRPLPPAFIPRAKKGRGKVTRRTKKEKGEAAEGGDLHRGTCGRGENLV